MRVLLRDDISGVGKRGDVVEVAKGFARNYLLPTGRALVAGDKIEKQAQSMRRSRDLRNVADRDAARSVAAILGAATITVTARAAAEGRLFGSVSANDVAEAIAAQTGAEIDRHKVSLSEPIKTVGTHVVPVQLHEEVTAEVTVEVVPSA
ncbi:MAG TPA: 50S ribosomal protein L9 [Acidimicrobiales bacterium]|nr:50S ribosomal protein L9 [Acidimicrobiales bacterium]